MHLLRASLRPCLRSHFHRPLQTRLSHTLPTSPCKSYLKPTHTASITPPGARSTELLELSSKYVLPVYARPEFVLSHGKGSYVWDLEGRKYLDFSAGIAVNALGHGDEGVAEVCVVSSLSRVLWAEGRAGHSTSLSSVSCSFCE
jgi:4-aminobutyrate aminotransferase-like enzyme